jgi:CubicO group peptidase (beta-lactamase class C family)
MTGDLGWARQLRAFAIGCILLAGTVLPGTAAAASLDEAVTEFLKTFNAKHAISGTSMGVAREGKLVSLVGVGLPPDRAMMVASNGKSVTAMAALKLIAEGKLNPDATLPAVMPKVFGGKLKDPRMAEITIKQLITHSAGFGQLGTPADPLSDNRLRTMATNAQGGFQSISTSDVVRMGIELPLEFAPGSQYNYSNMNYLVLGLAVETAAGQSFQRYIHEKVLAPAGVNLRAPEPRLLALYPFSNLQMTPAQFLKWMQVYDPGLPNPVTDADRKALIYTPHGQFIDAEKTVFYNYGWNIRPVPGGAGALVWHTGSTANSNSLAMISDFGAMWFVVMNQRISTEARRELEAATYSLIKSVTEWPTEDQFGKQKM